MIVLVEHVIEVNNESDPALPLFSREQLWAGLLRKVTSPQSFEFGPQACECVWMPQQQCWLRTQHFGVRTIQDHIKPFRHKRLSFTPQGEGDSAAIHLTIEIEAPRSQELRLRFTYSTPQALPPEEAAYTDFRRSAWVAADQDMVNTFRLWHQLGQLLTPPP